MKALSIHQPWASLIAEGHKTIETRTWKTNYRGPLAVHASKTGSDSNARSLWIDVFMSRASKTIGIFPWKFPRGQIIATCTLHDIVCYTPQKFINGYGKHLCPPGKYYQHGLYGWVLTDIKKLDTPIPCKGQLGLWELCCNNCKFHRGCEKELHICVPSTYFCADWQRR